MQFLPKIELKNLIIYVLIGIKNFSFHFLNTSHWKKECLYDEFNCLLKIDAHKLKEEFCNHSNSILYNWGNRFRYLLKIVFMVKKHTGNLQSISARPEI